jgi:putative transposase
VVRENQAVYLEDLCVAGLARTRSARAIHDAGWATLVRLIEEKAAQYGVRPGPVLAVAGEAGTRRGIA